MERVERGEDGQWRGERMCNRKKYGQIGGEDGQWREERLGDGG